MDAYFYENTDKKNGSDILGVDRKGLGLGKALMTSRNEDIVNDKPAEVGVGMAANSKDVNARNNQVENGEQVVLPKH